MPMPLVSLEIIASIREQSNRSVGGVGYCTNMLKEMEEENPHLLQAIRDTISYICNEYGIDTTSKKGVGLQINISNLTASVYQSIKQQMICDEL